VSPKPIDVRSTRAGLARLHALFDAHPELRAPEAQARLTAWLAEEHRTMIRAKGKPKGDEKARARVQRLRQRRKEHGWQPYELWLPPETAALLTQLKPPGEALHETVGRALRALQALQEPVPRGAEHQPYAQRKRALRARLRALQAEGLSLQAIANRFNTEGVPTLSGRGTWKKGTIGDLLNDAAGE
jgi:hypothetical protein